MSVAVVPEVEAVPVLSHDEAIAVATEIAAGLAATSLERDRDRLLPGASWTASRPPACSRSPCRPSTVAPGSRSRRWPRCSGCSRPATRASPRSRTATSCTSTCCATRARASSGGSSSARCWPAGGSATRSPRSAPSTSATSAPRSRRPATARWTLERHQGLQHRRALRRLDPGARPQDTLADDGPLHVAWVERHAPGVSVIDDWDGMGQRTTASGTVHLDQVEVTADRIVPLPPDLRGPADLRRLRAVAARRHRRRHRPRRARRGRRVRPHQAPALVRTPAWTGRPRTRWSSSASARWSSTCAPPRRCCARPPGPSTRPTPTSPTTARPTASLAVAAGEAHAGAACPSRSASRAVRGVRHPLGPRLAQPGPALAQRPHPHPARPGRAGRSSTSAGTSSTARRRPATASSDPAKGSTIEVPLVPAHQRRRRPAGRRRRPRRRPTAPADAPPSVRLPRPDRPQRRAARLRGRADPDRRLVRGRLADHRDAGSRCRSG